MNLLIVPQAKRDPSSNRFTPLDLNHLFLDGKIAPGSTVTAKIENPDVFTGTEALLAFKGFNLVIDGPDQGQAIFQGKPDGDPSPPPVGYVEQHYRGVKWANKGGWGFANGNLTVGAGIVIKNFTDGTYVTNLGGIFRNGPGDLILMGDGKRPNPLVTRNDNNLRLTTHGPDDLTFVKDADISGGGTAEGQIHNTYDDSEYKFYIRVKSGDCNTGEDLKLMNGLAVVAHCDLRNSKAVPKSASHTIDLNSMLSAIYDNLFNDEDNDQNPGSCVQHNCHRVWPGPHGIYFFGNKGRFAIPYRGHWLLVDNTAWDPRYLTWSQAPPIGFHDMALYIANNDERAVDMKLDYVSLNELWARTHAEPEAAGDLHQEPPGLR
jgi:hypothetical protein